MKDNASVSVVMTTFQGQRYLPEQLASIGTQTRPPDELVVGDDMSDDATEECVKAFARKYPHINVRFEHNSRRLGSSANFEATVRRARGDIVIFSDQDDFWHDNRIARLVAKLQNHPQSAYAFSNGLLMDDVGRLLPGSLFESVSFQHTERHQFVDGKSFSTLLKRNVVTGATLAVRRTVLLQILPFEPGWIHDYFIVLMAECLGGGLPVNEPLIRYRLHNAQQVGIARTSWRAAWAYARKQNAAYCLAEAENWAVLSARIKSLGATDEQLAAVDAKRSFAHDRAAMRMRPAKAAMLMALSLSRGDYARYSLGFRQWFVDVLSVIDSAAYRRRQFGAPSQRL